MTGIVTQIVLPLQDFRRVATWRRIIPMLITAPKFERYFRRASRCRHLFYPTQWLRRRRTIVMPAAFGFCLVTTTRWARRNGRNYPATFWLQWARHPCLYGTQHPMKLFRCKTVCCTRRLWQSVVFLLNCTSTRKDYTGWRQWIMPQMVNWALQQGEPIQLISGEMVQQR